MSGYQKILLLAMIGMIIAACHRSSGLITEDGPALIRIQIVEPEGVFVDRADLELRCIDCAPNQAQISNLVNVDINAEQIPVTFLNTELGRHRYTRGSFLSVDITYYDGDQPVLKACSGSAPGCRSEIFAVAGNAPTMRLDLRFEVIGSDNGSPDEEQLPNDGLENNPISNDIILTANRQQSIANGLCLGELGQNGESLGVFPGNNYSEVCLLSFNNQIHLVNSTSVRYISNTNQERYDIAWVAPILLEPSTDLDAYRPMLAGVEKQGDNIIDLFACRDRNNNRFGLTRMRNDGSNLIATECLTPMDTQGNVASSVQRLTDFEVLSYRQKLGM